MGFSVLFDNDPKTFLAVLWVLSLGIMVMSFQMFSRSNAPAGPRGPMTGGLQSPPKTFEPVVCKPVEQPKLFALIHEQAEHKAQSNPNYVPSASECMARAGAWIDGVFGPDGEGLLAVIPHWDAFEFQEMARVAQRLRMPDQAEMLLRVPELFDLYTQAGEQNLAITHPTYLALCADIEALEVEFIATGGAQRFTRVLDENLERAQSTALAA